MKNAELKKGLKLIIEGLSAIADSLGDSEVKAESTPKVEEVMNPPVEAVEDDLSSMKYAELKKLASSMGIEAKGTREELISLIREARENEDLEEEPVEEPGTPEADEVATDPDEEEEDEDNYLAKAKKASEKFEADEIIDVLKDVGIKATKKNYVEKLAEALKADLIDLDDDDEEEEVSEDSGEDEAEESEVSIGDYNPAFDPNGYNDPKNMGKKRAKACEELVDSILKDIEDEKLSKDDIVEYLEKMCTEEELDLVEDSEDEEQIVGLYLEIRKRFIDVDGTEAEPNEPYEIEEETPMCCGHELKFDSKSKQYICEICGEEYEAD